MKRHGFKNRTGKRTGLAILVCLIVLSAPKNGDAQPGRVFTPPPPPPPFIPPRPPVYTPPPPINHQQNIPPSQQSTQRQVDQFRTNTQQDATKTRLDADAVARMAKSSSGSSPRAVKGKDQVPNLAKGSILVTAVEPNTQGARLGLKKGDVLVSYGGAEIKSIQHLNDLAKLPPNGGSTSHIGRGAQ